MEWKVTLASVRLRCCCARSADGGAMELLGPTSSGHWLLYDPKSNPLSSTSLHFSSFCRGRFCSANANANPLCLLLHFHKFILSLFSYSFVSLTLFFPLLIFISHFVSLGLDVVSSSGSCTQPLQKAHTIFAVYVCFVSGLLRPVPPLAWLHWGQRGSWWCRILVSERCNESNTYSYTPFCSRKKSILYFYDRIRKAVNLQRQFPLWRSARALS